MSLRTVTNEKPSIDKSIVDGVSGMMVWPLNGLNLASPGPPGTYFDPLYPAKIDSVPGQPKK